MSEDSTDFEMTEDVIEVTQNSLGYETQIDIIFNNKDIWKLKDEYSGDFCEAIDFANSSGYAISDLDEDGYLEIIKSGYSGSGHYSLNYIYEVTDNGDLMEIDMSEMEKYDSQPDIYFLNNISRLQDDNGEVDYIVEDLIKDGTSVSIERYFSMNMDDNIIKLELLGYMDNTEGNIVYYLENAKVSEEAWMEWQNNLQVKNDAAFKLSWFHDISEENIRKSYEDYIAE